MAYPTVSQVKTWMGITTSGDDTLLTQALNGAIKFAEKHCSRVFVAASATKTFLPRDPFLSKDKRVLLLGRSELVSVTSITNGDSTTVAAASYDLHPNFAPYYQIRLKPSTGLVWTGGGSDTAISIVASWGYAAACPDDVFLSIMEIAAQVYRLRASAGGGNVLTATQQGAIIAPTDIPPMTLARINQYRR